MAQRLPRVQDGIGGGRDACPSWSAVRGSGVGGIRRGGTGPGRGGGPVRPPAPRRRGGRGRRRVGGRRRPDRALGRRRVDRDGALDHAGAHLRRRRGTQRRRRVGRGLGGLAGSERAAAPALRRGHVDEVPRRAAAGRGDAERRRRDAGRGRLGGRGLRPLHPEREPQRRPRVPVRRTATGSAWDCRRAWPPSPPRHPRAGRASGPSGWSRRRSGTPPRSDGTAAGGASTGSPSTSGTPSRRTSSRSGTAGSRSSARSGTTPGPTGSPGSTSRATRTAGGPSRSGPPRPRWPPSPSDRPDGRPRSARPDPTSARS